MTRSKTAKAARAAARKGNTTKDARIDPPRGLNMKPAWYDWEQLTVLVTLLPRQTTIVDVMTRFQRYGNIDHAEIYKNNVVTAHVRYSPPPIEAFWDGRIDMVIGKENPKVYKVKAKLLSRRVQKEKAPTPEGRAYPKELKIKPQALHFGIMSQQHEFMSMQTVDNTDTDEFSFDVDLRSRRIDITFTCFIEDPRRVDSNIKHDSEIGANEVASVYKARISFANLKSILTLDEGLTHFSLLIPLETPPIFFKRGDRPRSYSEERNCWKGWDAWVRAVDIAYDTTWFEDAPVSLRGDPLFIDIGKWTTYKITFKKNPATKSVWAMMKQAMRDYNISIPDMPAKGLRTVAATESTFWKTLEPEETTADIQNANLTLLAATELHLPFDVGYQLEVCISQGYFDVANLGAEFLQKLSDLSNQRKKTRNRALDLLAYVAESDALRTRDGSQLFPKRFYDPLALFNDRRATSFYLELGTPMHCTWVRKVVITPSTMYLSTPTPEPSNRVLRQYAVHADRFLRVQFTDELVKGRIFSSPNSEQQNALYDKVLRTLTNGIDIAGRHYEFLAFGNSQFRENGAYFFSPTEYLTCDHIREWMGDVAHIKVVAKYAARLGQCFSTTRALTDSPISKHVKEVDDIFRNGWCFTDGVGKISPTLAEYVVRPLQLNRKAVPSAFQFRLGGSKGLLVVWPDLTFNEVSLRPSQNKFRAQSSHLEVIKPSRYSVATLNRQTITILSSLGVPDAVFLELQRKQIADYNAAMNEPATAMRLLSRFVDQNGITTAVAQMIKDGFMKTGDPFFMCILQVWRAWSLRLLRDKARIVVEEGAFVFGCVDETRTLRGYREPGPEGPSKGEFPQIFIQVPRAGSQPDEPNGYKVVTGLCVVGRNPSLHPGDIRVVEAVDVPALHHLRDVVVFPATGDRDIPSMCSGGDLDGDDYFVIWDRNLIPPEQHHPPMIHEPERPVELNRDVQPSDLIAFFVRYMKNDSLSTIALAHLAQADLAEGGPKSPVCVELARLHSNAVDFPKSGQAAHMKPSLRPSCYPHFMEKPGRSYTSRKILGQLYDVVTTVEFHPSLKGTFDERIIRRFALPDEMLKKARIVKRQHDRALRQIMNQREIGTEFEVWSTFVLTKPRVGSDYQMQETMGHILATHRERIKNLCFQKIGSHEPDALYRFIAAAYRVTWEEVHVRSRKRRRINSRATLDESMPLISFPWIFEQELGRIANLTQECELADLPEISAGALDADGEDEDTESEQLLAFKLVDIDDQEERVGGDTQTNTWPHLMKEYVVLRPPTPQSQEEDLIQMDGAWEEESANESAKAALRPDTPQRQEISLLDTPEKELVKATAPPDMSQPYEEDLIMLDNYEPVTGVPCSDVSQSEKDLIWLEADESNVDAQEKSMTDERAVELPRRRVPQPQEEVITLKEDEPVEPVDMLTKLLADF
ncbi:RNA dependent RNA polymerase-domain-containing protein [Xylaria sp. CBS 124048]|nr:RNA dependent RNA polymerase-domain-containing protein [Xylaria sp. CBS 124048]